MNNDDTRKELKELLRYEPDDDEPKMSDWEIEFLDSVNQQQRLSWKQADIITRIWDRIFGGES